jgi:hypothetical protein
VGRLIFLNLAGQKVGKTDLTNYSAEDLFKNSNFDKLNQSLDVK